MQLEAVVRTGDQLITFNGQVFVFVGSTGTPDHPAYLLQDAATKAMVTVPNLDPCQLLPAKGDECVIAAAPFCRYADEMVAQLREQQKSLEKRSPAYKECESNINTWLRRKTERRVFEERWRVLKVTGQVAYLETMSQPKQILQATLESARGLRAVA